MPLWLEISIFVIAILLQSVVSYRIGYKKGAKYVLKEWKKVNDNFEEEQQ